MLKIVWAKLAMWLAIFLLGFNVQAIASNSVDSLKRLAKSTKSAPEKAKLLLELVKAPGGTQPQVKRGICHQILALKIPDSLKHAAHYELGLLYYRARYLDSLHLMFQDAIPEKEQSPYWHINLRILRILSINSVDLSDLKITEFLNESLLYCHQNMAQKRYRDLHRILSINLGELYRSLGEFEKALKILTQGELKPSYKLYNRIGAVYQEMGKGHQALRYQHKSLALPEVKYDTNAMAGILTDIGYAYLNTETKNLDSAYHFFREATKLTTATDERRTYASLGMARAYQHLAQYDSAIHIAKNTLPYLEGYPLPTYHLDIFDLVHQSYAKLNQHDSAYVYLGKYKALYEEEFNRQKAEELERMRAEYQVDVAEIEQSKAELKTEQERRQKYWWAALAAVILLVALGVMWGYGKQRRLNKKLAQQHETIEKQVESLNMLNREIYHRTKNNMQTMSSLLSLQKYATSDAETREMLEENENRMFTMGLIHKRLFANKATDQIDMKELLEEQLENLRFTYGRNDVDIENQLDSLRLNVDQAIPLALLLNEAFSNAFKHAYENHTNPSLKLALQKSESKVDVLVHDNGSGMVEEKKTSNGFGINLMKSMAKQLQGTLNFENRNGVRLQLQFSV